MKKYESAILNVLLDQYERSRSFIGTNKQRQSFSKKITDLFPEYSDAAQYDVFAAVNKQVADLERAGLIVVKRIKRGKIDTNIVSSIQLKLEKLGDSYRVLNRTPKADKNAEIIGVLEKYINRTPLLKAFCNEQIERIKANKKPQYSDDLTRLEQILMVLAEVESVEEETFIRNFSVRVLGDSKAFEKVRSAVISILCEYGGYPDKNRVLQGLNIVKNPGYVYVKGNGVVTVSGQTIDFRVLDGDLGLSSALLDNVEHVKVYGTKILTIENLTAFHSYEDKDAFVIYLGGYHNSIRRKLIRKIYKDNPDKKYLHYGDIDAGGFYILLDLRAKTGIPFAPFNMDVATLKAYKDYTKRLTENDKERLRHLLGGEFDSVVKFMLENDCKLEQEAVE